ncbi:conserved hypothetical protein [Verticillium alfalfae VaMs.102]|uniref:Uncharacterized protein n=1 Tax=Verticillium alfalfae (strain VaMs.102 / ATCC MYA-4576 / FGSC 10136) TaxID=526221 RepID=C9SJD6_VERA1|nr:conserved hypothetical protein [Verticillium alfalfae VaMs.102]EEY18298.1 conserved hypothetical protein [Verticillium alfalfae VaMs.102]
MTYGFNTGFKRQGLFAKDHIRAFDIARDLIYQLCHLRRGQDTRPLIMVAHSLGGLIVKQALVEARRSSQASIRTVFDAVISVIFFGPLRATGTQKLERDLTNTLTDKLRQIVDGLTASLGERSRPIEDDHEGMVKFEDTGSPAFKITMQDIWRALQNWTESKNMCIQRGMPPSHPAALTGRAPENLIESFNEWRKPFLIVYDNFHGVYSDDFASLMPTQGPCAIILTSRDTLRLGPNTRNDVLLFESDARSIGNDAILIDRLITTDALDLLLQVSGHSDVALSESEMSAAKNLLLQLERVPRLIESVGKCIGQLQQPAPFSAYLNAYMNRGKAIQFFTDTSASRMLDTSISDRPGVKFDPQRLFKFELLGDDDTESDTETSSIVRAAVFSGPESCSESDSSVAPTRVRPHQIVEVANALLHHTELRSLFMNAISRKLENIWRLRQQPLSDIIQVLYQTKYADKFF